MKPDNPQIDLRLGALRRFAIAITVFNVVGRIWFGFEGSWAQVCVTIFTAYSLEIVFEMLDSRMMGRKPRFLGGVVPLVNFLLPAHITAFAISMLLYATDRLLPYAFAAAVAILTKFIFTAPVGQSRRHFFNPSNTGIVTTAFLFPSIQITVPYQFTEHLSNLGDIALPMFIILTGTILNSRFTLRVPLILAWVGGFAIQSFLRTMVFGLAPETGAMIMSGVAFILFTFYMAPDPGTTPSSMRSQIIFGLSLAAMYSVWVMLHQPFGLFYALFFVCAARGVILNVEEWLKTRRAEDSRDRKTEVNPDSRKWTPSTGYASVSYALNPNEQRYEKVPEENSTR